MLCHTYRYESAKKTGEYDAETRRRENAKHSLERYMHYFERWDAHNKAREKVGAAFNSCGQACATLIACSLCRCLQLVSPWLQKLAHQHSRRPVVAAGCWLLVGEGLTRLVFCSLTSVCCAWCCRRARTRPSLRPRSWRR